MRFQGYTSHVEAKNEDKRKKENKYPFRHKTNLLFIKENDWLKAKNLTKMFVRHEKKEIKAFLAFIITLKVLDQYLFLVKGKLVI